MDDDEENHTNIHISCENLNYKIDNQRIEQICASACKELGLEKFELSVSIVDEAKIRELNKEFRDKDSSTDVLSFPQNSFHKPVTIEKPFEDNPQPIPRSLGDIVLCPEVAEVNAQKIGQSLDREVCFLMIHGLLHLCGHDHMEKDEEAKMLEQQRSIMASFATNSAPIWNGCITPTERRA